MKYYLTEESLTYILRQLKEKNDEIFVSKEEHNEDMVILEEDELTIDGLIDNTYPSLTTEDKTLLGAINEINKNSTEVIDETAIDEIFLDVFGTTIE